MKTALLVLLLLAAGCGKKDSAQNSWTQSQLNTVFYGCMTTGSMAIPSGTTGQDYVTAETIIATYCQCIVSESQSRWSADDFGKNGEQYFEQLKADGTVDRCNAKARE